MGSIGCFSDANTPLFSLDLRLFSQILEDCAWACFMELAWVMAMEVTARARCPDSRLLALLSLSDESTDFISRIVGEKTVHKLIGGRHLDASGAAEACSLIILALTCSGRAGFDNIIHHRLNYMDPSPSYYSDDGPHEDDVGQWSSTRSQQQYVWRFGVSSAQASVARSSAGFGADADQDLAYTFSHCLSYFVVEKGVRLDSRMDYAAYEWRAAAEEAAMGISGEAILAHVEEAEEPFLNNVALDMGASGPPVG